MSNVDFVGTTLFFIVLGLIVFGTIATLTAIVREDHVARNEESENDNVRLVIELLRRGEDWSDWSGGTKKKNATIRHPAGVVLYAPSEGSWSLEILGHDQTLESVDWKRIRIAFREYQKGGGPKITSDLAQNIINRYGEANQKGIEKVKHVCD